MKDAIHEALRDLEEIDHAVRSLEARIDTDSVELEEFRVVAKEILDEALRSDDVVHVRMTVAALDELNRKLINKLEEKTWNVQL